MAPIRTPETEVPDGVTLEDTWPDQVVGPMARTYKDIPEPRDEKVIRSMPMVPEDVETQLRGPKWAPPRGWTRDMYNRERFNPAQPISADGGEEGLTPDAQEAFHGTDAATPAALPTKEPWEMTPEELGVVPKAQTKEPWEMTPEELGLGPPGQRDTGDPTLVEKAGPGGTRGAETKWKYPDRTSVYGRAKRADVGLEGVSAAARLNARLAWGAVNDPTQELEIARRAISRDLDTDYPIDNVRIGPATRALEWVNPKTGKWDLFAGAGGASFFKDVAAAVPEIGEGALEAGAGILAGAAGTVATSPMGPMASAIGGTSANAAGSAAAAFYSRTLRLQTARERGLVDMSDDEIFTNAYDHMKWTAGATVGAAVLLKMASTVWRLARGTPVELLDAYQHNLRLAEGKPLADTIKSRTEGALAGTKDEGLTFPVTSGQQTALPEVLGPRAGRIPRDRSADEMLMGENAAARLREPGRALDNVYNQQEAAMDAVDFATFSARSSRSASVAGRELQRSMNTARERMVRQGEAEMAPLKRGKELSENVTEMMGQRPVDEVAGDMRTFLANAREQLFFPFKNAYDKLEGASSKIIDLGELRAAAREVKKRYGQDVIKELDSSNIPELRGALTAGLKEDFEGNLKRKISEPVSIGSLEKLRKEFTESIVQLENAPASRVGAPRAAAVLRDIRDGIDRAYAAQLEPEMLEHMHNLRRGYSEAITQFDKGVLGTITKDNGAGGFHMSGNDVVNYLVRDPANAKAFIDSIRTSRKFVEGKLIERPLDDATRAAVSAQEGVMSSILRQFKNTQTGVWDTKGLSSYLHKNRDALETLFSVRRGGKGELVDLAPGDNVMGKYVGAITKFQAKADALEARLAKQSEFFKNRFGVFTSDPAVLVKTLVDEGRVGDLRRAMALVKSVGGSDGLDRFKAGLANVARQDITDSTGRISAKKAEEFLTSERGRVIGDTMGNKWKENVQLLADMMKVRELQATGTAPRDLAGEFTRGVPGLQGMWRFLRVIMPPMAPSGRGLTAAVGLVNEKSQKKMAELMTNPDKLEALLRARFSKLDPLSKAGKIQLTRLGLEHIPEFWDMMKTVYGKTYDMFLDDSIDETQGQQEFQNMGKEVPTVPKDGSVPGGVPSFETPGGESTVPKNEGPPTKFMDRPDQTRVPYMEQGGGTMSMPGTYPDEYTPGGPVRSPSAISTTPMSPRGGAQRIVPDQTDIAKSQPPEADYSHMLPNTAEMGKAFPNGFNQDAYPHAGQNKNVEDRRFDNMPFSGVVEGGLNLAKNLKDMSEGGKEIIKGVGKHIAKLMETAVTSTDQEAQHRAATELATLFSGVGGTRTIAKGIAEGGVELGSAGGRLTKTGRPLEVIKGGEAITEETIDSLSTKLSDKLRAAADPKNKGDKAGPAGVKQEIEKLREVRDGIMKEAESLSPPIDPITKKELKHQGKTIEQFKADTLAAINQEMDRGIMENFKIITGGRDPKKPVTTENVKQWLEDAGAKIISVEKKGKQKTEYIKFEDPANPGMPHSEVRIPKEGKTHAGYEATRMEGGRRLDVGQRVSDTKFAEGQKFREVHNKNVSGEGFNTWENLIAGLKWRLSRDPDGNFLISPGKEPKPRARALALESEKAPTISRDPNQLEFNFGSTPFDKLVQ